MELFFFPDREPTVHTEVVGMLYSCFMVRYLNCKCFVPDVTARPAVVPRLVQSGTCMLASVSCPNIVQSIEKNKEIRHGRVSSRMIRKKRYPCIER